MYGIDSQIFKFDVGICYWTFQMSISYDPVHIRLSINSENSSLAVTFNFIGSMYSASIYSWKQLSLYPG